VPIVFELLKFAARTGVGGLWLVSFD
jgi:hypothetical protein